MAYLESNLGKEEKIISKGEVSFLPLIPSAVFGAIILIFGISAGFGGFIAALIIDAIIILPKFLGIKNTELGLTNKKVMGKYGIINTKVMDSPLNKVNSVTVSRDLAEKFLATEKSLFPLHRAATILIILSPPIRLEAQL